METWLFSQKQATHDSLNRTMQYGNKSVDDSTQVGCEGLNRTMQYGNFPTKTKCVHTVCV